MRHQIKSFALAGTFGAFAVATGGLAMVQTDLTAPGHGLPGGHYQRAVEQSFDAGIPLRSLSVHGWNALKLGLLGQPAAGAYLAASGRMFTTEELVTPQSPFHFATELHSAKAALDERGITLIPVIIPDKARVYAGDLGHARSLELVQRYSLVQSRIDAAGLRGVDLRDPMWMASQTADVFMWTDTHWSPLGARIAAKQVARHIADVDLDRAPYRTDAGAAEPFQGDLARFADTGPFRGLVGPRFETITPYTTQALSPSDDLFGDVDIPLALIGTSFSARTEFNFQGFLKQATGLDLINYAQSGQGPFQPMRDFLASDVFTSSPPKIVIWEIPERYILPKDLS